MRFDDSEEAEISRGAGVDSLICQFGAWDQFGQAARFAREVPRAFQRQAAWL